MKKNTFKKIDRITKRKEYQYLYRKSNKKFYKIIIINFNINSIERSRLGITVSKKVGNAVLRNKIKRIIRECFRTNRSALNKDIDINVVINKKVNFNNELQIIKKELQNFLLNTGTSN